MYNNILVPIDGSESSYRTLQEAITLGNEFKSNIYVLTVVPERIMRDYQPLVTEDKNYYSDLKEHAEEVIDVAKEYFEEITCNVETLIKRGTVDDVILQVAEEKDIGLIVMGNRGLGGFSRVMLGSVSNKVINKSPISVLIVKYHIEE